MKKRRGVAVIIRDDKNRVLLLKRGKAAKDEVGKWENPGGEIDLGEEAMKAAEREVKEELGVEIVDLQLLYSGTFPVDEIEWEIEVFEGKINKEPKLYEKDKHSKWQWFEIDEIDGIELASYTRADFERLGWLQ